MKSWTEKCGEVELYQLCEEDGLGEEELDNIHKRLHEISDKEN